MLVVNGYSGRPAEFSTLFVHSSVWYIVCCGFVFDFSFSRLKIACSEERANARELFSTIFARNSTADVIVVWAGVVGIATALQLRLAGMDVLLLDRDPPAAGTSSGNAGALAISQVIPLAEPGVLRQVPACCLIPWGR